jgi:hypothetical protein
MRHPVEHSAATVGKNNRNGRENAVSSMHFGMSSNIWATAGRSSGVVKRLNIAKGIKRKVPT